MVGCLTSQQHASVFQGWICLDNLTCCHTETATLNRSTFVMFLPSTPADCQDDKQVIAEQLLSLASLGKDRYVDWTIRTAQPEIIFMFVSFVRCVTSQQQASISQGQICSDNFTCYHTEIEAADQTLYLTQSQYTDTGPTSPSADPVTPGAWQGSRWSANFYVTGMTRPREKSRRKRDSNPGSSALEADALTTRPTRRSRGGNPGRTFRTLTQTLAS